MQLEESGAQVGRTLQVRENVEQEVIRVGNARVALLAFEIPYASSSTSRLGLGLPIVEDYDLIDAEDCCCSRYPSCEGVSQVVRLTTVESERGLWVG